MSETAHGNGETMTPAKPSMSLGIPKSNATVKVSIIDTTASISLPTNVCFAPDIAGFTSLSCPSYSFLIEHPSGRKALYDLGLRKDLRSASSHFARRLDELGWRADVRHDVREILEAQGVDVAGGAVGEIIWSHFHWDHTGNPSRFPASTRLVVGPGFKARFPPAETHPQKPESYIREDMWSGRELREVGGEEFDAAGLKVGRFRAVDWFGDGSFFLLDSPGHAVGHLAALARTTADPDSFIFMGGDAAHHGGELRPSEYRPLPKSLSLEASLPSGINFPCPCPGELLLKIHPKQDAAKPYLAPAEGINEDAKVAEWSTGGVVEFDGCDDVLVVLAHDHTLLDVLDFYPKPANGWKSKLWHAKARWRFITDFADAIEQACGENS